MAGDELVQLPMTREDSGIRKLVRCRGAWICACVCAGFMMAGHGDLVAQSTAAPADCGTPQGCLLLASRFEQARDLPGARQANETGSRRFPNERGFLENLARLDVLEAHYRQACERYAALSFPLYSLSGEAHYYWGLALHELGDWPGAHRQWEVSSRSPETANRARLELASDLAAEGHWRETLAAIAALNPWSRRFEPAGLLQVIALRKSGGTAEALELLTQWMTAFPADPAFTYEAMFAGAPLAKPVPSGGESRIIAVEPYLRVADYAGALRLLPQGDLAAGVEDSALLAYYRADCLQRSRQAAAAAAAYLAAGTLNAEAVAPVRKSALAVLAAAVKANKNDATAWYLLGRLHLHLEMPLEAVDDWRRAVRAGLRTGPVYQALILALGNALHDRNGALAAIAEARSAGFLTPPIEALEQRMKALPDPSLRPAKAGAAAPGPAALPGVAAPKTPPKPKPDLARLNDQELAQQVFESLGDNDLDAASTILHLDRLGEVADSEPLRLAYYEYQLQRALVTARKKECDGIGEQVALLSRPNPRLPFTKSGGRDLFDTPRALFYAGRVYGLCGDVKPAASLWKMAAKKAAVPDSPEAVFVSFARIQMLALAGKPVKSELEGTFAAANAAWKAAPETSRGAAEYRLGMALQALGRLAESDAHFAAASANATVHYLALVGIRDNDLARRGVK